MDPIASVVVESLLWLWALTADQTMLVKLRGYHKNESETITDFVWSKNRTHSVQEELKAGIVSDYNGVEMVEDEESMPYINHHWIVGIFTEEKLSSLDVPVLCTTKSGERWTILAMYVIV